MTELTVFLPDFQLVRFEKGELLVKSMCASAEAASIDGGSNQELRCDTRQGKSGSQTDGCPCHYTNTMTSVSSDLMELLFSKFLWKRTRMLELGLLKEIGIRGQGGSAVLGVDRGGMYRFLAMLIVDGFGNEIERDLESLAKVRVGEDWWRF